MSLETNNQESSSLGSFVPEQIEYELDQITSSSGFKTSIQMQNFLRYVVQKTLSGEELTLKQYTIALEALGQAEDFDPEINPLVRIEAGRLRKKLDAYYQEEGKNDDCIISIPVGRYVPHFEKNQNIGANTDTHIIPKDSQAVASITNNWKQSCGPRLLISCFTDKTQGKHSYKLLYFLTDNIAHIMSQFLFIRLVSAIPHADKEVSNTVIASYLDNNKTDYILTVNIHHVHDKEYQLACVLIEAENQQIIWSETYPLAEDKISNQREPICNNITAALIDLQQGLLHVHWARKQLLGDWDSINTRFKPVVFYRYHADNFTNESFVEAVKVCKQALVADAEDVVALTIYCEYCRREYIYRHGVIKDPLTEGLKSGQEAVRLKPGSHEAHYVLGQIWFHLENHELCKIAFEKSRRLSHHHSLVTFGTGFHLFMMEEWKEGMALVNQSMRSNPTHPGWFYMIPFLNHYRLGEYDAALIKAHQIVAPGVFWGPLARATAYAQLSQLDKARSEVSELIDRYPDFEKNGMEMLQRYFGSKPLFEMIREGLQKAGMEFDE